MKKLNKIYLLTYIDKSAFVCYSLEDAIRQGIRQFYDEFYEVYEREPINNEELENFISGLKDSIIWINVISGNRIRFKTSDELINYFLENINKINDDNLYDFLLSLVESDNLFYDWKGNLLNSEITSQCPSEEYVWDAHIIFTEESCKEGKYRFSYNDIGIDTLYNASWIRLPEK